MRTKHDQERWMQKALALAQRAADAGEVPVGAVVVSEGKIVGEGFNQREALQDPTAHAEILALTAAAKTMGSWRLNDTQLYVTLEPCPMCAGALVNARVAELTFGSIDPKAGAVRTLYALCEDPRLNHRMKVSGGILAEQCSTLLSDFFRRLRANPSPTAASQEWKKA